MRPVRLHHLHTSIAYASHSAPSASCDPHSGARRGSPHSHARHRDTMHAPTCLSARHHVLNQLRRGDTLLAKATTPVRLHTHRYRCAEASPGRVQQGPCMPHPPGRGAVVLPCHTSPNSHTDLPRSPATPASHRPQQPHLRLRLRLPCSSGFLAPPASLPIRRLRRPCPSGLPADPTVPCQALPVFPPSRPSSFPPLRLPCAPRTAAPPLSGSFLILPGRLTRGSLAGLTHSCDPPPTTLPPAPCLLSQLPCASAEPFPSTPRHGDRTRSWPTHASSIICFLAAVCSVFVFVSLVYGEGAPMRMPYFWRLVAFCSRCCRPSSADESRGCWFPICPARCCPISRPRCWSRDSSRMSDRCCRMQSPAREVRGGGQRGTEGNTGGGVQHARRGR
jgi:hypothetical protein